jgi:hypothetical protein
VEVEEGMMIVNKKGRYWSRHFHYCTPPQIRQFSSGTDTCTTLRQQWKPNTMAYLNYQGKARLQAIKKAWRLTYTPAIRYCCVLKMVLVKERCGKNNANGRYRTGQFHYHTPRYIRVSFL